MVHELHADSDGSNRPIRDEIPFVRVTRSRTRQIENKREIFDVAIPSVSVSCVRARQIENKKNKTEEIVPPLRVTCAKSLQTENKEKSTEKEIPSVRVTRSMSCQIENNVDALKFAVERKQRSAPKNIPAKKRKIEKSVKLTLSSGIDEAKQTNEQCFSVENEVENQIVRQPVGYSSTEQCSSVDINVPNLVDSTSSSRIDEAKHTNEQCASYENAVAQIEFSIGDVVWAKIKESPHWPAKITAFTSQRMIEVHWFNDYRRTKIYRTYKDKNLFTTNDKLSDFLSFFQRKDKIII